MEVREQIERLVRGWNDFETDAGADPVIDYNCAPQIGGDRVEGRFAVLDRLTALREVADGEVAPTIDAHVSYLQALLGRRIELGDYIRATQGCPARAWSAGHVDTAEQVARTAVNEVDVRWDGSTRASLAALSDAIDVADAGEVIRGYALEYEPLVRSLTGAASDFELNVETVDLDAYWAYWLDGEGRRARLRINSRTASFTDSDAYRFALHEVLGHALQYANLTQAAEVDGGGWVRQLAIHCPHQVLFEGLAQVLPLAVCPDDALVRARTRVDHFTQLISAELHVMINAGASATDCRDVAVARVPFWSDADVASILRDRALDPQLRSYLWAYPAGIDWFLAAYDAGGNVLRDVLHAGYQRPLIPSELEKLWPAGPRIGGDA